MLLNIALIAGGMVKAFLKSLSVDGQIIKALAANEAEKLASSLNTIGQLLRDGDIDQDEAETLIEVQKAATEAVFASLEGVSRTVARRATREGLASAASAVDGAIGVPLIATLTGSG
jgi:hypothetical protein